MKKCKNCQYPFEPTRPLQVACSPGCAMDLAAAKRVKDHERALVEERKVDKVKREAIKPRQKWLAEAQAVANRYARVRDRLDGCISCDKPASWHGQWHGSHFRSVGACSATRFNLWNIHKACSVCNNHLSGNIAGFTPRLIEKIGLERVEWLQAQNHVVRHSPEYAKKYKRVIGKRLKRMEARI